MTIHLLEFSVKKPMNLLPRITTPARRGFRGWVSWGPDAMRMQRPGSPHHSPAWASLTGETECCRILCATESVYSIKCMNALPTMMLWYYHPNSSLPTASPQTADQTSETDTQRRVSSRKVQQVSGPAAALKKGGKLTSQVGGVGLPLGWEGDTTQLRQLCATPPSTT